MLLPPWLPAPLVTPAAGGWVQVIGAKLWNGGERADAAAVVLSGETCLLVPMAQKLDRDRYTRSAPGEVCKLPVWGVVCMQHESTSRRTRGGD